MDSVGDTFVRVCIVRGLYCIIEIHINSRGIVINHVHMSWDHLSRFLIPDAKPSSKGLPDID